MLRKCAWLFVILLLVRGMAAAESKARIVRLSYVDGDVEMDRSDGHGYIRAFQNMPVIEGVRLWLKSNGRAEVEFEDASTLRLTPDTILFFDDLRLDDRGDKITRITLQQGTLYANVKEHDKDQFTVNLGQQQLKLRHSSRFRLDADNEQLKLAVFRGDLEIKRNNGQHVQVKKNETLALDLSDPERYYLSKGIDVGPYDYWDREREEQIVAAEARRAAPRASQVYGYDDLSYYGDWYNVPSYGTVWQPYDVGLGWSPFSSGGWVWYPRFGYTWVSGFPRGWTPFHFGNWFFINNFGWCWRPGPFVPFGVINVFNFPRGFIAPRPPIVFHGHPFAIVLKANDHPVDPRSDWMNRPVAAVNRRGPGGEMTSPRMQNKIEPNGTAFAGATVSPAPAGMVSGPTVSRVTVDHSGRIRTADRDYNNVDYRAARTANLGTSVSPSVSGRDEVNRVPGFTRGMIGDRGDGGRPMVRSGPSAVSPQMTPGMRPMPAPRMESPRPMPAPRMESPRVAPAPAPMRTAPSAPSPRMSGGEARGAGVRR